MGFNMKKPSIAIGYGGESNKQQNKNLMTKDPIPEHASALNNLNKGYGTSDSMAKMNGSPFHKGGTGKKEKPTGSLSLDVNKNLGVNIDKVSTVQKIDTTGVKGSDKFASSTLGKSSDSKDIKDAKRISNDKTQSVKNTAPKYKSGSEGRKAEYDAKGWKYDDTIKGYNRDGSSTTKKVEAAGKGNTETKVEGAKEELKIARVEAQTGQADRQDTRKSKRISKRADRVSKREDIRKGRAKAKADGLKGSAKRDAIKTSKVAAKKKQAEANK